MKSIKKAIGHKFKSRNQHLHKQTKAAYQKWKLCTLDSTIFIKGIALVMFYIQEETATMLQTSSSTESLKQKIK